MASKKKAKPKPKKKTKSSPPTKPVSKPASPKPSVSGKPEELRYTSAQYPVKELYHALLARTNALTHAGYECLWHHVDISDGKGLLLPHHVNRVDEHTLRCWPIIVSDKKTGSAAAMQLGLEVDILENVAVLKGSGKVLKDANRYEIVHEILSQFKALTGIQLTVEAKG